MKPIAIEAVQMTQDSLPTVAATAPMENSTKGGTPLATQKAPVQSMPRSRPAPLLTAVSTVATSAVELISCTPYIQNKRRSSSAISKTSPTMPYLATPKIDASASELTATMVLTCFMPARCWMAPETPMAMYSLQALAVLPD